MFYALANLTCNTEMGDALVNAGAIAPAVNFLASADAGAREKRSAAMLLARLAGPKGDAAAEIRRQAMLAAGAAAPLRALQKSQENSTVQLSAEFALDALRPRGWQPRRRYDL